MDRSVDWMEIDMIARSFGSKRMMTGSFASGGSWRRTRATLEMTSCCASMVLTLSCMLTRTEEFPSDDVEVTSLIPCTVFTDSSMGREMSRSMTSGEAPGYVVLTLITGYVTSGYSSMARRV